MNNLFLSVLNMSLTGSYVILFVILVRLLLKKMPKGISYALWIVVAFRLLVPISFESEFSLLPRKATAHFMPRDTVHQPEPPFNGGVEVVNSFFNHSRSAPSAGADVNLMRLYMEIGASIWLLGMAALLAYSVISVLQLRRRLKHAHFIESNVFEAENVKTPFVLGVVRPKIYLPAGLHAEEKPYILLHEQTHLLRKDHIIKRLSFLILSLHWFNPMVWIAFTLMSADMEMSCDERVLKEMGENVKKPYANSLLSLAVGRRVLSGSPLAFGEGNVKGRIKSVLNYRKPGFWLVVVAILIVAAVGIGLMVNPPGAASPDPDSVYATSEKWAEALKNRDGKARYEMMAPESQEDYYNALVKMNGKEYPWHIGSSSPSVVSYEINTDGASAVVTYVARTSEPKTYICQERLSFVEQGGKTLVSKYSENISYLRQDIYEQALEIQKNVNEGHQAWRLNPESVALEFVHKNLNVEGGKVISVVGDRVVFQKEDGTEIEIQLYKPVGNGDKGFWAIFEYSIGTNHVRLDNNSLAP